MEEVLAAAKKAGVEAEFFTVDSDDTSVRFEADRLKHVQKRQSSTVTLRIIRNGKIGIATGSDPASQDLLKLALETARFGIKAEFSFPTPMIYPEVAIYDPLVDRITGDEMISLGTSLLTSLKSHTPELHCNIGVTKSTNTVRIVNSNGVDAGYIRSTFSLNTWSSLVRDTDILFVSHSQSSCHPITDSQKVAATVIRQLEFSREIVPAPVGECPVIFTPEGVSNALMPSLISAFNGKMVLENASPLAECAGQRIFDEKFTLQDDPTLQFRPSSRPFDDEGIPSVLTDDCIAILWQVCYDAGHEQKSR